MASFLNTIDLGLRALLFDKYDDILSLENVNRGVIIYPKEVAFRMISEKKGSMISEFINFWRIKTAPSWSRTVSHRPIQARPTDTLSPGCPALEPQSIGPDSLRDSFPSIFRCWKFFPLTNLKYFLNY